MARFTSAWARACALHPWRTVLVVGGGIPRGRPQHRFRCSVRRLADDIRGTGKVAGVATAYQADDPSLVSADSHST